MSPDVDRQIDEWVTRQLADAPPLPTAAISLIRELIRQSQESPTCNSINNANTPPRRPVVSSDTSNAA